MSGLGGLNKSSQGVVIGLVQLQLPVVVTQADLAAQTARICALVGKARRNQATMDLVVFRKYRPFPHWQPSRGFSLKTSWY